MLMLTHCSISARVDVRLLKYDMFPRNFKGMVRFSSSTIIGCVDWSSRVEDVLYVIAGNQGKGGIPMPTDHFNGITTAYTATREGIDNYLNQKPIYDKFWEGK